MDDGVAVLSKSIVDASDSAFSFSAGVIGNGGTVLSVSTNSLKSSSYNLISVDQNKYVCMYVGRYCATQCHFSANF